MDETEDERIEREMKQGNDKKLHYLSKKMLSKKVVKPKTKVQSTYYEVRMFEIVAFRLMVMIFLDIIPSYLYTVKLVCLSKING